MESSRNQLTLFELNRQVKELINKSLPNGYWVVAEISEINEHPSGHCYLELIQKDEAGNGIKAKARASIWSYTYRMLKPYFETATNRPLARGMSVLVKVQVAFHELYGYSLNVMDIEPGFTLGDIELKRRETIDRLNADGVMRMNQELELDLLPNRIAIVSSASAAGLQDFIHQLNSNPFGYRFTHKLFPSVMQGDEAESSITNSLNKIYDSRDDFDVVAIVRGGGAQTDLACFDSYHLSSNIAQFPLPILTGIGHDKDVSVADMVAHKSLKTPTAVAEFLISKLNYAEELALALANRLQASASGLVRTDLDALNRVQVKLPYFGKMAIAEARKGIARISETVPHMAGQQIKQKFSRVQAAQTALLIALKSTLSEQRYALNTNAVKLSQTVPQRISDERNRHLYLSKIVRNLNPVNILARGYSITYHKGKALKSTEHIAIGDEITTTLHGGSVVGTITQKKP